MKVGGKLPEERGHGLGFCSVGREGANCTEEEIETGTEQMTNLTCFTIMQREGP